MPKKTRKSNPSPKTASTETYQHPESELLLRPEVGTQAQFRKKKRPVTYRYDSSLSPALEWDGQNAVREYGEWLLGLISEAAALEPPHRFAQPREFVGAGQRMVVTGLQEAVEQLKRLGKPFLNWAGKAERLSFDVPTLPLFVHERLSTKHIVETLTGHLKNKQLGLDLFGDPQHTVTDQVLRAYEYKDKWVNRLILGDSLVVMNSLLHYEGLGGQVQMVYMDPPYGIKFGSNFQPFVRRRDVNHNADEDMTREPEMVKAYRDTWELGLHSYLTYMRDRLLLARELLTPSGSIFVQISDENLHHVRELMDEVFGEENFVVTFCVKKKGGQKGELVDPINDYILWYAKDEQRVRGYYTQLYKQMELTSDLLGMFSIVELADGRVLTLAELEELSDEQVDYRSAPAALFRDHPGVRLITSSDLTVGGTRKNQSVLLEYQGRTFDPGIARGMCWKHTARTEDGSPSGMQRLAEAGRLLVTGSQVRYKRYLDDFGYMALSNWWDDVGGAANRIYAVQTNPELVKRCMLMSTKPGDLVLDPTCGSGTTAYVAEQWGRRWITADVSRVPLALTRQRLLTATFPYYQLKDESRGPAGGFVYVRKQDSKGREVGGIVPHVMSTSIANNEPPDEEVLVDRPETQNGITRVTGAFCFEATIPTPVDWEGDGEEDSGVGGEEHGSFLDRMIEVLRKSPVLHLGGGKTVTLKHVRQPAKTLSLSAEAVVVNGDERPAAIVFGPENGAVSQTLVFEAAKEASAKRYTHLYVIGFAIQPNARELVDNSDKAVGISATYVQATPDLMMGDLLKNLRSSQIFSVCGLPEVRVLKAKSKAEDEPPKCQVELLGLDVFDPATNETHPLKGDDVPAWFLDTDYNGLCFHVCQAFFPRTSAWDNLKRSLRMTYEESVWDHLAGAVSAPFEPGEHQQVAVKVIDDRGNELLVVKKLGEAKG